MKTGKKIIIALLLITLLFFAVVGFGFVFVDDEISSPFHDTFAKKETALTEHSWPEPELYIPKDTVIYSEAPRSEDIKDSGSIIIPLENLPVRGKSFEEICSFFGADKTAPKSSAGYVADFPYRWSSIPLAVWKKCKNYPQKELWRYIFNYKDESGSRTNDALVLWVFEEGGQTEILWGCRVNELEFNLE